MARYVLVEEEGPGFFGYLFIGMLTLALVALAISVAVYVAIIAACILLYLRLLTIAPRSVFALTIYSAVGWCIGFKGTGIIVWTSFWLIVCLAWVSLYIRGKTAPDASRQTLALPAPVES